MKAISTIILLFASSLSLMAQQWPEELIQLQNHALQNHPLTQAADYQRQSAEKAIGAISLFGNTEFYYFFDEVNLARNDEPITVWGVQQSIQFPITYLRERDIQKQSLSRATIQQERQRLQVQKQVAESWLDAVYFNNRIKVLTSIEELYTSFSRAERLRNEAGESNRLGWLRAQSQLAEISAEKQSLLQSEELALERLRIASAMDNLEAIVTTELTALLIEENGLTGSLVEELAENTVQRFKAEQAFAKSKWWPNLNVELFQGTNQAPNAELYQGIRLGAQIPLQLSSRNNEISQSKLALKAAESEALWSHQRAKVVYEQLNTERQRLLALLQTFDNEISRLNNEALKIAQQAYEAGEIAYLEYAQTVEAVRNSELQYLDRLLQYNRVIIQLRYFDFNL